MSVRVMRNHMLSFGLVCVPSTVGSGRRQNTILVKVPGPEESQEDQDSGSEASDSVSNSGNTSNTQNGQTVTLITLNSEGMALARTGTHASTHTRTHTLTYFHPHAYTREMSSLDVCA